MSFLAITWDPSIGIDLGFFIVRWYSLMFVAAFLLGLRLMKKIYVEDKIPAEKLDVLFMYVRCLLVCVWEMYFFIVGLIIKTTY